MLLLVFIHNTQSSTKVLDFYDIHGKGTGTLVTYGKIIEFNLLLYVVDFSVILISFLGDICSISEFFIQS